MEIGADLAANTNQQNNSRRSGNFPPTLWGCSFASFSFPQKANLESLAMQSSPRLGDHIRNALTRPFHKGLPRIEARKYISFYEEHESRNDTLLKFAKTDFNRVVWNALNFAEELPYARDRIVEIYFWVNGIHFEPQYDFSRMMASKYTKFVSLVDDTYDAHASFEELQHFTDAFERCSKNAIDQLPADYMKALYIALLNLFNETENDMGRQGRSYASYYVKEAFKELVRGYHAEAEWADKCHVPTFDEYVLNGLATSASGVIMGASFLGLEEVAGVEEYDWLKSNPKIIKAAKMICRLMNDIVGHEDEQKRGDCASGVECYMKQYNILEKKAIEEIQKMNAAAWKDINEDCMRPTKAPMLLLQQFVNLVRVSYAFYANGDDAYTIPLSLKDYVTLLFIEQAPLCD
ncbi:hypothetical protein OIU78_022563 [Salix suchowensis]|nr:hypothetical protein OIU78_022563 [Salix suchowensis]